MKKLLVLGGNYSTVQVVKYAKEQGLYVIVTSNEPTGDAKVLSDESIQIDVKDHDKLVEYIKNNNIDGVMTGASEFHILNMIQICKKAGLPVYATEDQWNICQNKLMFKDLCRKYGVPCVKEFNIEDDPQQYDYPVIIKPSDGCSARGITVCQNVKDFNSAVEKALAYSIEKKIIIEKFMENEGITMSVKYIAVDGNIYLEAVGDRYVLESDGGKALITAAAFYPSKIIDFYIEEVDHKVKSMFKGLGIKNGVMFLEAIANEEGVWFYEMGLRISAGMTYKITEKTNGINELRMLIDYAVSGKMCDTELITKINPYFNGYISASIALPLRTGNISNIFGMDKVSAIPEVGDITQYWNVGDIVQPQHFGTLDQLFARIPIVAKGKERLTEIILSIKTSLSVLDKEGKEMIIWSKLDDIYKNYTE